MVSQPVNELLDEAIETELLILSEMERGSETRSNAVKDLAELYKLRIEEAKAEQAKTDSRTEAEMRQEQAKSQATFQLLNFGTQLLIAGGSLIAYNFWFRDGLKFEETGTVRNPWTRSLMTKMLPMLPKK